MCCFCCFAFYYCRGRGNVGCIFVVGVDDGTVVVDVVVVVVVVDGADDVVVVGCDGVVGFICCC